MFSSAEQWIDGIRIWRAEHNGEHGPINIKTAGVLPLNFRKISETLIQEQQDDGGAQAGVDHYFDIPLQAAKAITGFKHDEEIAGIEYDRFDLLLDNDSGSSKNPWWRFWTFD